jgi:hypothetical protein
MRQIEGGNATDFEISMLEVSGYQKFKSFQTYGVVFFKEFIDMAFIGKPKLNATRVKFRYKSS